VTDQQPEPGRYPDGISRRRVVSTAGVAALGGLAAVSAGGILTSRLAPQPNLTLPVDEATTQELVDLSRRVCGGGVFDPGQATMLLRLLAADPDLSRGFVDLRLESPVAGTTPVHSDQAAAAMRAILGFWYVGEFAGEPVANRAAVYSQMTAWQAMYTAPFAVCKAFGAWAEAPDDQPAQPAV
jgi:hypothetical protein